MAIIGHGYGSEWHLLRWMGRHRNAFNHLLLSAMDLPGKGIEWEDSKFRHNEWPDEELQGLEFLADESIRSSWKQFWPSTGRSQTWDAVGWIESDDERGLVLLEAKAHLSELTSNCQASPQGGRGQIERALAEVKQALGVSATCDWLTGYYQYANRLAALQFLRQQGIKAHLVLVYFTGDASGKSRDCPATREAWLPALTLQDEHLGLTVDHPLAACVHKVFIDVAGTTVPKG